MIENNLVEYRPKFTDKIIIKITKKLITPRNAKKILEKNKLVKKSIELQEQVINVLVESKNFDTLSECFSKFSESVVVKIPSNVLEKILENSEDTKYVIEQIPIKVQKLHIDAIFNFFRKCKENSNYKKIFEIWEVLNEEVQESLVKDIFNLLYINKEVTGKVIINHEGVIDLWEAMTIEMKKKKFSDVLNIIKKYTDETGKNKINCEGILMLWEATPDEVQRVNAQKFPELLDAINMYTKEKEVIKWMK